MDDDKQFTRITYETAGYKTVWECSTPTPELDELCNGFFSLMIGQTWLPRTVLEGMKEFSESILSCNAKNSEETGY